MNPRNVAKLLLPPIVLEGLRIIQIHQGRGLGLIGDYSSWNEAVAASIGYDSELILEKTKNALLKVKNGDVIYERDSVLFNEIHYTWPLLAGLMWVAAQSHGRLNVLDFGGSLGSTYYQNRTFLRNLPNVQWNIIEQPAHVKVGKEYFEDDVLKFFPNIESCLSKTKPNVILFSSVLQYLENPYEILNKLLDLPCEFIIIDRTPFCYWGCDKLYVQKTGIFDASYPMWIFSLNKFREFFKSAKIVEEFSGFEAGLFDIQWKGFIVKW